MSKATIGVYKSKYDAQVEYSRRWIEERGAEPSEYEAWASLIESQADPDATAAFQQFSPAERNRRAKQKADADAQTKRDLRVTLASGIEMMRAHWLWGGYIPIGELTLIGGREGAGKSSVAYDLTASITRGVLPGEYHGTPRMVVAVATEDSWSHTIVPRLTVAGADLDLVARVDVAETSDEIIMPDDLEKLGVLIVEYQVVMVLLDPLLSRLNAKLDTHKDAEVRQALEPLTRMAHDTGAAITGIIHVNKGSSADVMNALMGSRAFGAVARSVLFVMRDPDDENGTIRLCGHAKNNLGPLADTLRFAIADTKAGDTTDGPVYAGKIMWQGVDPRTVSEAAQAVGEDPEVRTATAEAADWLKDYLGRAGGVSVSSKVKDEAKGAGIGAEPLRRGRLKLRVLVETAGTYPRTTYWRLPAEKA